MRTRTLSLSAAALLVAGQTALAQTVLLRFNPPAGQTGRYRVVAETYMTGGQMAAMMTDPSQPLTRMTMYQTRTVTSVQGDQFTVRETTDSVNAEFPAMPQMAMGAGAMTEMLRGMVTEQVMTTRGRVVSQQIVSGGPQGMPGMGRGGRGAMPGMGGGRQDNNQMMVVLPERPVRVGDTWADSMVTSGEGGGSTIRATFRLERMDGPVAVIGMRGTMSTAMGPGGSMTMDMTGEIRLHTVSSRLMGYRMDASGSGQGQMGDMQMRIHVVAEPLP
jgi:hypothetical protein